MRHVFVNVELAGTLLLSGTVTSATKTALFVQSGEFVGMGVSGVGVELPCLDGVSVATGVPLATIVSVASAAWVPIMVDVTVSTGSCMPQAEANSARKRITASNLFLIETSFLSFLKKGY